MFHEKQFLYETFPDICSMARKKWTPQPEVTDAVLKFREKRKWQIALRRYVLEQRWSAAYAPFFGIDILRFREWIALQFSGDQVWHNFSEKWQFDHILPVAYFDFLEEHELRLCWNFTNIRVQALEQEAGKHKGIDILGAKDYFVSLYNQTGYAVCGQMIQKIDDIERAQKGHSAKQEAFLEQHRTYLTTIASFSEYEYSQLNEGIELPVILEGRAFSKRVHDTDNSEMGPLDFQSNT